MARLINRTPSRIVAGWVTALSTLSGGAPLPFAPRCDAMVVNQSERPTSQRDRSTLPDFACGPAAAAIVLMLCDREVDDEVLQSIVGPSGEASMDDDAGRLIESITRRSGPRR